MNNSSFRQTFYYKEVIRSKSRDLLCRYFWNRYFISLEEKGLTGRASWRGALRGMLSKFILSRSNIFEYIWKILERCIWNNPAFFGVSKSKTTFGFLIGRLETLYGSTFFVTFHGCRLYTMKFLNYSVNLSFWISIFPIF